MVVVASLTLLGCQSSAIEAPVATPNESVIRVWKVKEEKYNATPVPTPVPTEVPVVPTVIDPEPVYVPPPYTPKTEIESAICSVGWPDCGKALRVARCESTDYYAPYDGTHIGAFQINVEVHAWRFAKLGLNIWDHGDDPYYNSAVAYWIYKDRGGWGAWPYCGYR